MRWLFVLLVMCSCREAPIGHRLDAPLFTRPALPACTPGPGVFCGVESSRILELPHQGFQSFHTVASQLPPARHPRARVAYARFWWDELEPAPGQLRFELIDEALTAAAAEGQTFAFRVMPEESRDGVRRVPAWLADAAGGTWGLNHGVREFSPNYDAPAFLEAAERTIAALGARYDGDPRIEHVDVGFVGDSGEWADVAEGASLPSSASTERLLSAFAAAFPRTRVLMLVGAVKDAGKPLAAALSRGMGWRADCWGDLRAGWNHHDDFYEQRLAEAGALEAWRRAPVAVETCGEMEAWDLLGYDEAQVRWLLRWALEHHVSLINNKSRAVPTRFRPVVDEYLALAGPRLMVFRATRSGGTLKVELLNRGTTPPYWPWRLALRDGEVSTTSLATVTDALEVTFTDVGAGPLELGLLDEEGALLPLANEGGEGWLRLE